MRELARPPEVEDDPKATEMIRVWIAHNDLHVSLLLGVWEDVEEWKVEEHEGWGKVLADVVQHIAPGWSGVTAGRSRTRSGALPTPSTRPIAEPEGEVSGGYVE